MGNITTSHIRRMEHQEVKTATSLAHARTLVSIIEASFRLEAASVCSTRRSAFFSAYKSVQIHYNTVLTATINTGKKHVLKYLAMNKKDL